MKYLVNIKNMYIKGEEMKTIIVFFILILSLIGQADATSDYIVTWNFNGNSNDNFMNPSINYNIKFENGSAVLNGQSLIKVPYRPDFSFENGITIAGFITPKQVKHSFIVHQERAFLLQITDFNRFQAGLYENINGEVKWTPLVESDKDVVQNKSYKVIFTYDNKTAKLYIDNNIVSIKSFTKPISKNTNNIALGNKLDLSRGFVGKFDKIEIINRALTEQEVARRYVLGSSEVSGNSVCEGYENKDNSPDDCGKRVYSRSIGDLYHSKDESIRLWKELVQNYPKNSSYEVIGKSSEGRNIYLFKFGNPNGGKFMFDGQLHGAEDCGTETGYKFVKWVLESNDPEAIRIKNKNYLLAIPVINIDTTSRQNMRRVNDNGTLVPYGVDLNRNFAYGWGASWSGTSDFLDNYDYRGQGPASEPETKAVTYAMQKYKPAVYMNVHCGMQALRYSSYQLVPKILQRINEISNQTGASTISLYDPSGTSGAGLAIGEGANQGASSWLFEISKWDGLPLTLDEYHNKWYKEAFPVYAAMSNVVEK